MAQQIYISTRKGVWIATTTDRRTWSLSGPTFLGQQCHHVVLDPRDRRTLLCASRQWHLGPTVFRSADGGAHVEGGIDAAAVRQGRAARARGGPRVLAHAGACERARCVVRGHLAERALPQRGRGRDVGAGGRLQRSSPAADVGRQRQGRNARWRQAPLDPRGPARPRTPLPGDVGRRGLRIHGQGRRLAPAEPRRGDRLLRPRRKTAASTSSDTTRTASCSTRSPRTVCGSRTTAVSTGWIGQPHAGCVWARRCRPMSETSGSASSLTHGIPTRRGFSRWMARATGPAPHPVASRRCLPPATLEPAGSAATPACPPNRRGGR